MSVRRFRGRSRLVHLLIVDLAMRLMQRADISRLSQRLRPVR